MRWELDLHLLRADPGSSIELSGEVPITPSLPRSVSGFELARLRRVSLYVQRYFQYYHLHKYPRQVLAPNYSEY